MPQSSDTSLPLFVPQEPTPEYSSQERSTLLQLAHDAILSMLENREMADFRPSEHLRESRGAFSTIYTNGKLRGCVGYPTAVMSLYRTIIETARAAAFDDPRFIPITLAESRHLQISLSILSPLFPIRPEDVIVGRHGLVISLSGFRGLLLPQVPVEHGWDREIFLEQTCRKAGLPLSAWREGATIEAFTAEVFGDKEIAG